MRNKESKRREGMRCRKLLLLVVLGAVGLLAAPSVMAQTPPPQPSGSCYAGAYLVQAFGPTFVTCGTGDCTQIEYKISGGIPDHAATVVASGFADCSTPSIVSVTGGKVGGNQPYAPGVGDPVTGLGRYACHEEATKINPVDAVTQFKIVVAGQRSAAPKSVVTKKGGTTRSCEIVGIGEQITGPNPFSTNLKVETLVFKGCAVTFQYNLTTGEVMSAVLEPQPTSSKPPCAVGVSNDPTCCWFNEGEPVSGLSLTLNGQSLGDGQFGEGYISSGTGSCTTRVIGGKVYTWGCPCPQ